MKTELDALMERVKEWNSLEDAGGSVPLTPAIARDCLRMMPDLIKRVKAMETIVGSERLTDGFVSLSMNVDKLGLPQVNIGNTQITQETALKVANDIHFLLGR